MRLIKMLPAVFGMIAVISTASAQDPSVKVEPVNLTGPRPLAQQTQTAVVRDYLESWKSLGGALEQNRVDLLDRDFVGTAKEKLLGTIEEQAKAGISAHYQDQAHDIRIVAYSPEGLSVELVDNVDYDVDVRAQGKTLATQKAHARYVVVMSPAEVRWRVRILQAEPQ